MPNPSTSESPVYADDPTRTTCYTQRIRKLASCLGMSELRSADDVIKEATLRLTQSGQSRDLTLDEWLTLGNNFRTTNKEHA